MFTRNALKSLAAAVAFMGAAYAQTPGDASIDQRTNRATGAFDIEQARAEAILTGRDDLVLLQRRKFFTLQGALEGGYTTNAALSDIDEESDKTATADVALRAETKIAGRVDIHAQAGLSSTSYREFGNLDYTAIVGSIGAHTQWRRYDFDLAYTPILVYDRALDDRQLTQHRIVASVGRTFSLPRSTALRVSVSAERIETDPKPFANSALSLNIAAGTPLSRAHNIYAFVALRGVARNYDNYFEGLVGTSREDRLLEGSLGASWQIRPNVALQARWTQSTNDSTSDVNAYAAGSGSIGISAHVRF